MPLWSSHYVLSCETYRGAGGNGVLRRDGFRVFFFSDEGWEPPHVHVERGGGIVKYWLGPTTMAYYRGMTFTELRRSMRLVEEHQDYLLERWHDYFGP
jgi:hypothetical protein